ncbi:MAG: aspartate/glutamate racemase family protein [bacterium]|nr:aspartate/glutamate racemase family protein [bacterium]
MRHAAFGHATVGVLSSETTAKSGLYVDALKGQGAVPISLTVVQQDSITEVITHVMAGLQNSADVQALQAICNDFQSQGASAIVLGCTELPLFLQQEHITLPLYDAVTICAKAALIWVK